MHVVWVSVLNAWAHKTEEEEEVEVEEQNATFDLFDFLSTQIPKIWLYKNKKKKN